MLDITFRNEEDFPQPLIPMMRWMLMQILVTSTMTTRIREQRFDYATQLLRDVRMHARDVLARLANYTEWHRTVILEKVRSNFFYRVVPSTSFPSVLEPMHHSVVEPHSSSCHEAATPD